MKLSHELRDRFELVHVRASAAKAERKGHDVWVKITEQEKEQGATGRQWDLEMTADEALKLAQSLRVIGLRRRNRR